MMVQEIQSGPRKDQPEPETRFPFGRNWRSFLDVVDRERIEIATRSLQEGLGETHLAGKRFLDIGCGSGLFSLGARLLGAQVVSFDLDEASVVATRELRAAQVGDDPSWILEQGSVLDAAFLARLGTFDVVYAWGVLHRTGQMWTALGNVLKLVSPGGTLFVSIYNDQGWRSRVWRQVKYTYNKLPNGMRLIFVSVVMAPFEVGAFIISMLTLKLHVYVRRWTEYKKNRGMSRWHDWVDWVGGYPFEVAKPEDVFGFCRERGFELHRMKTCGGGLGCNEFVFRRKL